MKILVTSIFFIAIFTVGCGPSEDEIADRVVEKLLSPAEPVVRRAEIDGKKMPSTDEEYGIRLVLQAAGDGDWISRGDFDRPEDASAFDRCLREGWIEDSDNDGLYSIGKNVKDCPIHWETFTGSISSE